MSCFGQESTLIQSNYYYDNDGMLNLDRYYTFGLKISLINDITQYKRNIEMPKRHNDEVINRFRVVSIGQQTFSPANTYSDKIQKNDRPYAGWLWGGYSQWEVHEGMANIYELQIGIVGPSAGGEKIMSWFHHVMGYHKPRGWQNQLRDELGINLALERKWKVEFAAGNPGYTGDWVPSLGIVVGNVHSYLGAGSVFRYGWNIPKDYGPVLILPGEEKGIPSEMKHKNTSEQNWQFYLFILGHCRHVIRNIFLDGNTAYKSHRIQKELFVADVGGGGVLGYGNIEITLSVKMRTREFIIQPQAHSYGSFILSWLF